VKTKRGFNTKNELGKDWEIKAVLYVKALLKHLHKMTEKRHRAGSLFAQGPRTKHENI
jgi:hypothetical protein